MKNNKNQTKSVWLAFLGGTTLLAAGCSTVVRENIISSIDTGIGATVAENKQTQLYELKAGYIHSQFYSIPTGKLVENEANTNRLNESDHRSNRADITPQLVSGIHAKTSLADVILGIEVSESFAVGSDAVKSTAAIAMYISDAKNTNNAVQAASAVDKATQNISKIPAQPTDITARKVKIVNVRDAAKTSASDKAKIDAAIVAAGYASYADFCTGQETTDDKFKMVEASLNGSVSNF